MALPVCSFKNCCEIYLLLSPHHPDPFDELINRLGVRLVDSCAVKITWSYSLFCRRPILSGQFVDLRSVHDVHTKQLLFNPLTPRQIDSPMPRL